MRPTLIVISPLLVAASIGTAEAFDDSRFYQGNERLLVAAPAMDRPGIRHPAEDFVLGPTGIVEPTNVISETNTIDAFPPASHTDKPALVSKEILNTSYSIYGTTNSPPECGPSRFQPAEIEAFVEAAAGRYGVDASFAKAIAWTESRFDQTRNSPKGARGPMQLMPQTALDLGVTDICNSEINIDAGVRHLKALMLEFGNPLLVAAAYNAGAQAVYDNGGIPPYSETVRYVSSVLNRQMGVVFPPAKRGKTGFVASQTSPPNRQASTHQASDVLGAKGGRFVNGVMHF